MRRSGRRTHNSGQVENGGDGRRANGGRARDAVRGAQASRDEYSGCMKARERDGMPEVPIGTRTKVTDEHIRQTRKLKITDPGLLDVTAGRLVSLFLDRVVTGSII